MRFNKLSNESIELYTMKYCPSFARIMNEVLIGMDSSLKIKELVVMYRDIPRHVLLEVQSGSERWYVDAMGIYTNIEDISKRYDLSQPQNITYVEDEELVDASCLMGMRAYLRKSNIEKSKSLEDYLDTYFSDDFTDDLNDDIYLVRFPELSMLESKIKEDIQHFLVMDK